jgi:acyl-CoA reductase-like NAD-dependent aldehyde dehydrogenase
MRDYTRIYIDGAWVKPLDGKIIEVINPATERPAGHITLCTAADVDRAVAAVREPSSLFPAVADRRGLICCLAYLAYMQSVRMIWRTY